MQGAQIRFVRAQDLQSRVGAGMIRSHKDVFGRLVRDNTGAPTTARYGLRPTSTPGVMSRRSQAPRGRFRAGPKAGRNNMNQTATIAR
jgi:hypothetical protein